MLTGLVLLALFGAGRVVITEVMANPAGGSGIHAPEDRNEFVELYNASRYAVDLADWTIDDGDAVDRLAEWTDTSVLADNPSLSIGTTWLGPGGFAVVLDSEYTNPDTVGGYARPYHFGSGTLLLTTCNTTIGNGLAGTDPLTLIASSAYAFEDTSTFGTPQDSTDSLPCDAGDGISWERVHIDQPDRAGNWTRCLDSAGCTPGAPNSILSWLDLAVTDLAPGESLEPGDRGWALVRVANTGFTTADSWRLECSLKPGAAVDSVAGGPLEPGADVVARVEFTVPRANAELEARLVYPDDGDTLNNACRVYLRPGVSDRLLSLDRLSFSPNKDGFEDDLAVMYRVARPGGKLSVAVFDLAGREVRSLCRSLKVTEERGVLAWDGTRSSGAAVPVGVYAVWLEYRESGTTRVEKLPVVVAR